MSENESNPLDDDLIYVDRRSRDRREDAIEEPSVYEIIEGLMQFGKISERDRNDLKVQEESGDPGKWVERLRNIYRTFKRPSINEDSYRQAEIDLNDLMKRFRGEKK